MAGTGNLTGKAWYSNGISTCDWPMYLSCLIISIQISWCPFDIAVSRQFLPSVVTSRRSAPLSSNRRKTPTFPFVAAAINAVHCCQKQRMVQVAYMVLALRKSTQLKPPRDVLAEQRSRSFYSSSLNQMKRLVNNIGSAWTRRRPQTRRKFLGNSAILFHQKI